MTHRSFASALFFVALVITGNAVRAQATTDDPLPTRPLNLSLPRDAVWSGTVRNEASMRTAGREGSTLPDMGARMGNPDARGRLPYGSGYEARQRDGGTGNQGMATGDRGQGRGGMGRGR